MRLLKLVPDSTNVGFVRLRNPAMAISLLLMLASLVLVGTRGLNLGIDFVGGQSVRVEFADKAPPVGELRAKVAAIGLGDPAIQQFGASEAVTIRTALPGNDKAAADAAGQRLVAGIKAAYPTATTGAVETVSGKVSGELLQTGAISLLLAMVAISVYIWLRFEWQFGVGALFALVHDVVLTFGFFAATQLQFDLNIVAALLTIIGYSLNDTIVVYDRIRENLKKYRKMDILALLDLSLNETLARTVMTSLTMLIALLALVFIGPDVIFGFSLAMLWGIFVGTYSSIYTAAPILVWLKVGPNSFIPHSSEGAGGAERVKRADDGAVV